MHQASPAQVNWVLAVPARESRLNPIRKQIRNSSLRTESELHTLFSVILLNRNTVLQLYFKLHRA